jgi:hypothetical protein
LTENLDSFVQVRRGQEPLQRDANPSSLITDPESLILESLILESRIAESQRFKSIRDSNGSGIHGSGIQDE